MTIVIAKAAWSMPERPRSEPVSDAFPAVSPTSFPLPRAKTPSMWKNERISRVATLRKEEVDMVPKRGDSRSPLKLGCTYVAVEQRCEHLSLRAIFLHLRSIQN